MTKLDPVGEPSMDEILASIRRIISEEPPGSRAQPDARAVASKEPAAAQADAVGASDIKASAFRAEPSFGSSGFAASQAAPPARQPDAFTRLSPTGKLEVEQIPLGGGRAEREADITHVLGAVRAAMADDGRTEPSFGAPQHQPITSPASNVQAAIDSLMGSPASDAKASPTPTVALSPRPGFTVSRDGFIPPADKAASQEPADPFEFSLGPSPFARQSPPVAEPFPVAPAASARGSDAFGSIVPARDVLAIDKDPEPVPTPPVGGFVPVRESSPQPDLSAMGSVFTAAPRAVSPAAPAVFEAAPAQASPVQTAPVTSAIVPAAAAPQPLQTAERPMDDARPVTRPSASFEEIATPVADAPVWQAAAADAPAAPAFSAPPTVVAFAPSQPFASPAPAAPVQASPVAQSPVVQAPTLAPAFTAGILETLQPQSPAVAPNPGPAPAAAPAPAPIAAYTPASPAPVAQGTANDVEAAAPAQAALKDAAAAVTPTLAVPVMPSVEVPVVTTFKEPPVEFVEAIIEPAAADLAPAEQDAEFEDATGDTEEPAAASAPDASPTALAAQALVATPPQSGAVAHDVAPPPPAAASENAPAVRTMEDTVADLLRPMLRDWLSENMPRIVERALRKELEESNRSEHKSAAE